MLTPDSLPVSFERPNYDGAGAANLMASLRHALAPSMGAGTVVASTLLDISRLREARHVILLVVDGLGSRQLEAHAPSGCLAGARVADISAVFPSTTASAITTYVSAEPPSVHGLVGWHTWFPSLGVIGAPLPYTVRGADVSLSRFGLAPQVLFSRHGFFPSIERRTRIIHPHRLIETPYTRTHTRGAVVHPFVDLDGMREQIEQIARSTEVDFSYAYWPELDTISHVHGSMSEQAREHLLAIDAMLERTRAAIESTGTLLMVSADHGFVDTREQTRTMVSDHPELAAMLQIPLSGEPRSAICHVRGGAHGEFQAYVRERLHHACEARPSQALMAEGHFGPLTDAHPELATRLGDFMLLMKDEYCIVDRLPGERPFRQVGVHGGMSDAELRIPLIVLGG